MDKSNKKNEKGQRIAKVMARAGLCSRREAERWIEDGRVRLNGKVLETPATLVVDEDRIVVDEKLIAHGSRQEETRLWRYYKPDGLVTSHKDEKGRETVFDSLPEEMPRVISVGRLDLTTEGLLLLTNDGALSRYLELPSTGWKRRYRVRVFGDVDEQALQKLKDGITIDGVRYGSIEVVYERQQGSNAWLMVSLKEGKNREIRRVMEHLGLQVNRLIRLSYGPFQLGNMKKGEIDEITGKVLKEQLAHFFEDQKK